MKGPIVARALLAFTVLILALELLACAGVPFVSEDWTHFEEMRPVASLWGALDPGREPLRPVQHAFFWVLGHSGADPAGSALPLAAHLFGFALHALACVLVFHLARAAGASGIGAWIALALFAAFPNVKSVAWCAAIGNPGRVFFELCALLLLARQQESPSAPRGAAALAAFVLALACHESAMLLPAILAAWIVFLRGETPRAGLARLWAARRDPWIVATFALAVAYAVQLFLRPSRYHRAKSLDALPANAVKAATALLPEDLRVLVVDGFRAHSGPAFLLACGLFALLALGAAWAFWRSRHARFVLVAVAIELGLPALGAGFVQRYAYFSSALVAVALAAWFAARGGRARAAALVLLGAFWARDSLTDAADFRALGPRLEAWHDELRAERERAGPGRPIVILDPPDMIGAEEDVPLFNWGLDYALEAQGIPGPWLFWRTRAWRTSTNFELVDRSRVEAAEAAGARIVRWRD